MLTIENGEIVDEYDKFINIGEVLPEKITELTSITNQMLVEKGISEERIARDLKRKLTSGTIMIAHNCQFDLLFVYNLLKRHYPNEAYDIVKNVKWIDTLTILKDRKDYPHKLKDAVIKYGVDEVNFHSAIEDTKALYHVTLKMKEEDNDLAKYINIFGFNPKWDVSGERLKFITYVEQPYHNCGCLLPEKRLYNMVHKK